MKARIFLSAADRPDPAERLAWKLLDARGGLLREGTGVLADIPRAREVEAVVPAERVLFARLRLPRVNAATIRELLPYAVEDRLLADPANVHAVPGPTNARGETVVAVIDREWLRGMQQALAEARLDPGTAWCESAFVEQRKGDWNVVLGTHRGMLVDDEAVAVTFDRPADGALPLALRLAIDEAASLGDRPTRVRVHTAQGAPRPDLARWSSEGGVDVQAGGTWEALAAGAPAPDSIDLLQGQARVRTEGPRIPAAAVWIAVGIAVLQLAFTAYDAWRMASQRRALEARQEAVFREAFPEAKIVVDPPLQMARNRSELERTRGLPGGDDFLAQLSRAARADPTPARSVTYANGRLEVRR